MVFYFWNGAFLHDPGTFVTLDKKSGLDVGGMTYDMISYKNKVYVATRNGLFVYSGGKLKITSLKVMDYHQT